MANVLKMYLHWSMYWLSKSLAMLFSLCHVSQFLPPSVCACAGVTCQNRYSLDMSCPIFIHLSAPFSTPAGTRQRKPVCGTGNLYAYSTLLSTIFTLAEFMFKLVVKLMSHLFIFVFVLLTTRTHTYAHTHVLSLCCACTHRHTERHLTNGERQSLYLSIRRAVELSVVVTEE